MTIGIAASCKTKTIGDSLICVADTEFSHGYTSSGRHFKYQMLGGKWIAMLSANDLQHAENLVDEISQMLVAKPDSRDSAYELKNILRAARDAVRKRLGEEVLPPGLSLADFIANGKTVLPDWAYTEIWNALQSTELQCELLVVGVDKSAGVHLLSVGDDVPGSHDRESFYAIGSGSTIADAILSACDQSDYDDWHLTAYQIFSAKKCSERAEGVGGETLMMYIATDGLWGVNSELLQPLYDKYGPLPVPTQKKALVTELDSLALKTDEPTIDWRPSKPAAQPGPLPASIEGAQVVGSRDRQGSANTRPA